MIPYGITCTGMQGIVSSSMIFHWVNFHVSSDFTNLQSGVTLGYRDCNFPLSFPLAALHRAASHLPWQIQKTDLHRNCYEYVRSAYIDDL